jgi:hypothetical protein
MNSIVVRATCALWVSPTGRQVCPSLLTAPGVSLIAEDSNRSCTVCCMLDRRKQCSGKLTSGKNINYTGCLLLGDCARQGGRHRCRIATDDVTYCAVLTAPLRTRCIIIIFVKCPELLLHLCADVGEVVEQRSNYV